MKPVEKLKPTKKYYIDNNGKMVRDITYRRNTSIEVVAEPFYAKLKIVEIKLYNNGFHLVLQDKNGKTYYMDDIFFEEYLTKTKKDMYLEGNWNFYRVKGSLCGIGLEKEDFSMGIKL